MENHISQSKRNNTNMIFHKALRKYGISCWSSSILFSTQDKNVIDDAEISLIEHYNTYKNGYNMTLGGKVLRGENHPNYNIPHSKEHKQKISNSLKGRKVSNHTKHLMSENNHMKGKTQSRYNIDISRDVNTGKNGHKFNGYYHTPYGLFESAHLASNELLPHQTIIEWCKNPDKIIRAKGKSKYLKSLFYNPKGLTRRELGFWFISI